MTPLIKNKINCFIFFSISGNTVDEQIYYKRINEDIFGHLFNRNKPTAPASLPLSKSKKKTIKEQYPLENASKKKLLKSQEDINDTDDYLSFPRLVKDIFIQSRAKVYVRLLSKH